MLEIIPPKNSPVILFLFLYLTCIPIIMFILVSVAKRSDWYLNILLEY